MNNEAKAKKYDKSQNNISDFVKGRWDNTLRTIYTYILSPISGALTVFTAFYFDLTTLGEFILTGIIVTIAVYITFSLSVILFLFANLLYLKACCKTE